MISEFQGINRYLSNFWYSPTRNTFDNDSIVYRSAEHAFQAAKSSDWSDRIEIANIQSPYDAKKAGRLLTLRPRWEQIKGGVMLAVVRSKFDLNPLLMQNLMETYPQKLIEGNDWHDNTWGICDCSECVINRREGWDVGRNLLGRILQHIRFENLLKLG